MPDGRTAYVELAPAVAAAPAVPPAGRLVSVPTEQRRRRRLPVRLLAALGLLTAAALVFRSQGIGIWYWIDEGLTVGLSRADLVDIPGLLRADGSPPLYYVLLHLWTSLTGTGEVATHALSLLFATATVPVGFVAADRLFGRRAAWITAGLFAFSPFLTHFSRETRMYTLVVLLGLVAVAAFVDGFVLRNRG